jgi:N-acetylmuramoyl-L-alanine amidase
MKNKTLGEQCMKRNLIEPVLGFCLLGIVILAVKYGSIHVTGSTDAYIKEMPVVVIDAGHGGTDPGKVGVDGSLEKDINLAVAKRLKTYLEQDDIRVIMTRETDTGLYSDTDSRKKMADMKKRCEIIEESGADLVVSIHQNSYHEESVSGGQVFYYRDSAKGKALAEILQKRFSYVLGEQNRRLPKANGNYYLLLHVKCPIVIVECGFLSNRKEAGLLNSGEYQDKLAYTIHMGVAEYLNGRK